MLFRPSFCCNCGERIERPEWKLWTSRKFCDLCSTDFTLQELLPKGIVALAAIVSVMGIVNYFSSGQTRSDLVLTRAAEKRSSQDQPAGVNKAPALQNNSPVQTEAKQAAAVPTVDEKAAPRTLIAVPPVDTAARPAAQSTGPVYFCGAETKKGTPCSRKVKGNVRCWQHAGMPAMLPADKLLVSR